MLKRKYIYMLVAGILVAGIAGILWTAGSDIYLGKHSVSLLHGKGTAPQDGPGTDSSLSKSSSTAAADGGGNYSLVMNLLKSSRGEQLFGSYKLKGTILNESAPESASATIEDLGSGINRVYSLSAELPDHSRLVSIAEDHITLQKWGPEEDIPLFRIKQGKGKVQGVARINDYEYNLNPYDVFNGDAGSILNFSLNAASRNGHMEGIRISDIEKHPFRRDLGLKENDVLVEVNGEPVDSLVKGVKTCINAYNSDELLLKIRRGDKLLYLTYHLYWEGKGSWTPGDQ